MKKKFYVKKIDWTKINKMVFDVDGVVRNLYLYLRTKYFFPPITSWNFVYRGMGITEWLDYDDLKVLEYAPRTTYFSAIKKLVKKPEFWTAQPTDRAKEITYNWLKRNFSDFDICFLSPEEKQEALKKNKNIVLVEDYPKFKSYDRIILVDNLYNKRIQTKYKVYNKKQLEHYIKKVSNENRA